jgi:galactokinase
MENKGTGGFRNTMSLKLNQEMKASLDKGFSCQFGHMPERYYSAPGRTEIGGNHTDHQRGCVLAGAVNLDSVAAVRINGTNIIRLLSEGYPLYEIKLSELAPVASEINSTAALIRGVAARFIELGAEVKGFDAYIQSTVLPGSGLSSSAAFEVLLGTICNSLFFDNQLPMPEIAKIGQYAENVYFGKPCGLMDQMASAVGNLVAIDFGDPENPIITPVDFDFSACGYALCIIDSKASHADLTDEYAAVPNDMKAIAGFFGATALRDVPEAKFYSQIAALRAQFGDRSVLRAMHFYDENNRVGEQVKALQNGNFDTFLQLVRQSGQSSWMYLQNVIPAGYVEHQDMAMVLGVCHKLLGNRGAFRVHGGGFAGTIQAFVPVDMLEQFCAGMDAVLGEGACHILTIRPYGGVALVAEK